MTVTSGPTHGSHSTMPLAPVVPGPEARARQHGHGEQNGRADLHELVESLAERTLRPSDDSQAASRIRVATKYTEIARQHFADKGVHVDLIKLYGSMELAPLTGLADAIVDLVSTGSTLKANHLVEVERIIDISSRLVVNQTALKLKREPIRRLIDAFTKAVG